MTIFSVSQKSIKHFTFCFPLLISLLFLFSSTSFSQTPLINEVVTSNITGLPDEYDIIPYNCPVSDCNQWYNDLGKSIYDGDYPGWVEIYNPGASPINLNGYGLSDDSLNLFKWTFPSVTIPAGSFIHVFTSGKDRFVNSPPIAYLHTNFKLKTNGEAIFFSNSSGLILDEIDVSNVPIDFSLGRTTDGNANWSIFITPTPLSSNTGEIFNAYSDSIVISDQPGIYSSSVILMLSSQTVGAEIRYTTDGSTPTTSSTLFVGFHAINDPTTIKARVFNAGKFISPVFTGTYIVGQNHSLPIVCISTPPDNLWDGLTGMYTPGTNADEANRIANYWNDWERPAHIELFEDDGTYGFDMDLGIKVFGWGSRTNDRRSFALMFRNKYGEDKLNYPVFKNYSTSTFNSLVLRDGGQDWQNTLMRDPVIASLVKNIDIDRQATRFCIVYLNGDYWGIYNIREKLNEDYLANHYGLNKDSVDIISRYWRRSFPVVIEGSDISYSMMELFLTNSNLSTQANYDYTSNIIDIENIINYYAINIFAANYDWPGNNNKCWRTNNPDGKWRWFLYDLDYTFQLNNWSCVVDHNTLEHATNDVGTGWPNPNFSTLIFRSLLENATFRNKFINRISDFMNSIFDNDSIIAQINLQKSIIQSEMPDHINKWGTYDVSMSTYSQWESNIAIFENFANNRAGYVQSHITNMFGTNGWNTLTLNVSNSNAGKIRVNSLMPYNYSWSGQYVSGVPVKLSVLPNPGYKFTGWTGVSPSIALNNNIEVDITSNMTITAYFETDAEAMNQLIINEISYHPYVYMNSEDWVEIYNGYNIPIDLSGWVLKDGHDGHLFTFPDNTIIQASDYIVVCQNASDFNAIFPDVQNYIGDFIFGLDNDGELIRLINPIGEIEDSLRYDDIYPWTSIPDGNGPTLSLLSPELDNANYINWVSSGNLGTPGEANIFTSISESESKTDNSSNAFPNPFSSEINILFTSMKNQHVQIEIYDLYGRLIKNIYQGDITQGTNSFIWNGCLNSGSPIKPGIYIYSITGEDYQSIGKIIKE